ncbi:MAG: hypothetical protein ACYCW6_05400 [Candidatus Xenobia bacterium]
MSLYPVFTPYGGGGISQGNGCSAQQPPQNPMTCNQMQQLLGEIFERAAFAGVEQGFTSDFQQQCPPPPGGPQPEGYGAVGGYGAPQGGSSAGGYGGPQGFSNLGQMNPFFQAAYTGAMQAFEAGQQFGQQFGQEAQNGTIPGNEFQQLQQFLQGQENQGSSNGCPAQQPGGPQYGANPPGSGNGGLPQPQPYGNPTPTANNSCSGPNGCGSPTTPPPTPTPPPPPSNGCPANADCAPPPTPTPPPPPSNGCPANADCAPPPPAQPYTPPTPTYTPPPPSDNNGCG